MKRNSLLRREPYGQFIEDLLDVSRCLAGELRLKCTPVVLAPLIKNAVVAVQQLSEAKRQTLTLEVDGRELNVNGDNALGVSEDGELSVTGDARRLEQVISNLVSNAIKYTPDGGRIEVKLARVDTQPLIDSTTSAAQTAPAPVVTKASAWASPSSARS